MKKANHFIKKESKGKKKEIIQGKNLKKLPTFIENMI